MLDDCDISFSIDLTPIKTISILLGVLEEASAVVIGRCFFPGAHYGPLDAIDLFR